MWEGLGKHLENAGFTGPSSYLELSKAEEGVLMTLAARSDTDYRLRGERARGTFMLNSTV